MCTGYAYRIFGLDNVQFIYWCKYVYKLWIEKLTTCTGYVAVFTNTLLQIFKDTDNSLENLIGTSKTIPLTNRYYSS